MGLIKSVVLHIIVKGVEALTGTPLHSSLGCTAHRTRCCGAGSPGELAWSGHLHSPMYFLAAIYQLQAGTSLCSFTNKVLDLVGKNLSFTR